MKRKLSAREPEPQSDVGADHEIFVEWAKAQGVDINGISPARFPGRGLGVMATRKLKAGETIVKVPVNAMFKISDIPESFRQKFPEDTSSQALMAAFFTLGDQNVVDRYKPWCRVWPTRRDFQDSMPLIWPEHIKTGSSNPDETRRSLSVLPPSISGAWNTFKKAKSNYERKMKFQNILPQEQKRFGDALDAVKGAFPGFDYDTLAYYWTVVNSRSFYFVPAGSEAPADTNEAIAMCPFADYFNHSDEACDLGFDDKHYYFKTAKDYDQGEEVYVNYGPHTNDFLLTHYGFFLQNNAYDTIFLDDIIFNDLDDNDLENLDEAGYIGHYEIHSQGPCYRTEVAAALKSTSLPRWKRFVVGNTTLNGKEEQKKNALIVQWTKAYLKEAVAVMERLDELGKEGNDPRVKMLQGRWTQIINLCQNALDDLEESA